MVLCWEEGRSRVDGAGMRPALCKKFYLMLPIVQISLDLTNLEEALVTAALARRAGVDWLEAGTPLILAEGLHGVRALRERFPGVPIVADLKTMDGGYLEAEMMAKAGATHVVVMARAHEETLKCVVKAGRDYGINEARAIIDMMAARGASVPIPVDVVCAKEFSPTATATVKDTADVAADDLILDIGPKTAQMLAAQLRDAGTIVWNGPVGVFEFDQFGNGTKTLALAVAESNGFSIAGGGDTLAAIAKYQIADKVNYISTGGGAFLEFLEGKTLPAVEILEQRAA